MGILGRKRGVDIDFTLLQRKGLMKKSPERKLPWKVNSSGFIELNSPELIKQTNGAESVPTTSQAAGADFLGNMVAAGQASGSVSDNPLSGFFDNPSSFNPPSPPSMSNGGTGSVDSSALDSLKVKLDDLEYKLERLLERIEKLEISGN